MIGEESQATPPSGPTPRPDGSFPVAAVPSPDLSHARHELRTPVGHILGYAEILIEDAGDQGWTRDLEAIQSVVELGKSILGAIDLHLGQNHQSPISVLLASLRPALSSASDRIIAICETLLTTGQGKNAPRYAADVAKVRAACFRLSELVDSLG